MSAKPLHRGPTRVSVGCDGGSFSSPKERCKAALFWGGSIYIFSTVVCKVKPSNSSAVPSATSAMVRLSAST